MFTRSFDWHMLFDSMQAAHAFCDRGLALLTFLAGSTTLDHDLMWIIVFGFATVNIMGLGARHLDPRHKRRYLGEIMAVMVVLGSVMLFSWETFNLLGIFPIKLHAH